MSYISPVPASTTAQHAGTVGVLLVNLGTPDGTGFWQVRRYLSEFLSDRRVIEANPLWWQPLLQGVILTTRPCRTGAAYRSIWFTDTDESPLRRYTRAQAEALAAALPNAAVDWAMRYGKPSIAERVTALAERGCTRVLVVPLYPQYSATTTATVNDAAFRALMRLRHQPALRTLPPFPDHPLYISALAERIRTTFAGLDWTPEALVGSFHGLPRRYVEAGDPYPADCARTMVALRRELGLSAQQCPMTFQSRFGREPWLEPYTDEYVAALARQGVTRIAVAAPGFLADCVETLEELGQQLQETFLHAGGEKFCLVPCLNDSPASIEMLAALVRQELAGWVPPGHG